MDIITILKKLANIFMSREKEEVEEETESNILEIKDIMDKMPTHSTKEYPERDLKEITHIDIHHSASLTVSYSGIETIKSFANHHINTHNWAGIGYHYIVTPDLEVYKTGFDSQSRWSVGNHNGYTISTLIVGSFDKEEISEDQYDLALQLVRHKMRSYSVPKENVKGHNEYAGHSSNACPGINMEKFRGDL